MKVVNGKHLKHKIRGNLMDDDRGDHQNNRCKKKLTDQFWGSSDDIEILPLPRPADLIISILFTDLSLL